jgi:hypothetical protein
MPTSQALNVSITRNGGLVFFRFGRLGGSFYLAKPLRTVTILGITHTYK